MKMRLKLKMAKFAHEQMDLAERAVEVPFNPSRFAQRYKRQMWLARHRTKAVWFGRYVVPLIRKEKKMKEYRVVIGVRAPDDMSEVTIRDRINDMIASGLDDVQDMLQDPELDHTDAKEAMQLEIGDLKVELVWCGPPNPCSVGALRKEIEGLPDETPCYPRWSDDPPDDDEPGVRIDGFARIEKDHQGDPGLSILVGLFYLDDEGEYRYDSLEECVESGEHGDSVDDDGYCNHCGEMTEPGDEEE